MSPNVMPTLVAWLGISVVVLTPVQAQTSTTTTTAPSGAESSQLEDIIVTARKKEESLVSVPLAIDVLTTADLETHAVEGVDEIARMVPGLTIGEGGGTNQGGIIVLRGIAGPSENNIGDQAVSFNIDGFSIAKSSVRRMGEFDLAQAEVLKGPQTLYFGKDSPGGVISLTTADPTPQFEAGFSSSYEFMAQEERTEDYISGPLTDTLGGRLAVVGDKMRGWVHDTSTANSNPWGVTPPDPYGPQSTEFDLRGTLKWNPSDDFSARFKSSSMAGAACKALRSLLSQFEVKEQQ